MVFLPLRLTGQRIARNARERHGSDRGGHGGSYGFQHGSVLLKVEWSLLSRKLRLLGVNNVAAFDVPTFVTES
jgi:hypothetical protein